jgi:hypothetical protein
MEGISGTTDSVLAKVVSGEFGRVMEQRTVQAQDLRTGCRDGRHYGARKVEEVRSGEWRVKTKERERNEDGEKCTVEAGKDALLLGGRIFLLRSGWIKGVLEPCEMETAAISRQITLITVYFIIVNTAFFYPNGRVHVILIFCC